MGNLSEAVATIPSGRWYPTPPPGLDGEDDMAYTKRLLGKPSLYDHTRFRECSLGFHLTCSCRENRRSGCECPCHSEPLLAGPMYPGASILAELWDLPDGTADHVMRLAAPLVAANDEHMTDRVYTEISVAYQSDVSEGFVTDVVNISRNHLAA